MNAKLVILLLLVFLGLSISAQTIEIKPKLDESKKLGSSSKSQLFKTSHPHESNIKSIYSKVNPVSKVPCALETLKPPGFEKIKNIKNEKLVKKAYLLKVKNGSSESATLDGAPLVGINYLGNVNDGYSPMDNSIAISNGGWIVSVANSTIEFDDTQGSTIYYNEIVNFLNDPDINEVCNPVVIYDAGADRFVFSVRVRSVNNATSYFFVCFSKTNDPNDGWWVYRFTGNPLNDDSYFSYPRIAVSTDDLVLAGNLFYRTDNFNQAILYQMDKNEGYNGAPMTWLYHYNIPGAPFALNPLSHGQESSYGPGCYMVAVSPSGGSSIDFYDLTDNVNGSPSLNYYSVPSNPYSPPANAYQLGTSVMLETNDCRVFSAFYLNGIIHFVYHTDIDNDGWSRICYNRLDVSNLTNSSTTYGLPGTYDYVFPSVVSYATSQTEKSVMIGFARSGSSIYPEERVVYCDNDMNWSESTLVKSSSSYVSFTSDPELWGFYSGTSRKHNNAPNIWMSGSYGTFDNKWDTWNAEIFGSITVDNSEITIKNVIQNNSSFPIPSILWHGSASSSAPPLKICADGSSATHIEFINHSSTSSVNIGFRIKSDPESFNHVELGYFINDSIKNNIIFATYHHPSFVNNNYQPFRADAIQVFNTVNGNDNLFEMPLQIFRAPILFVHGLFGDPTTFEDMENSLCDDSYYTHSLCYRVNYKTNSLFGFEANKFVIPISINQLLDQCRSNSISAARVDIISHSMGGILSRLYLQGNYSVFYRHDVNRIITLNTPHSGSQLANLALGDLSGLGCRMLGYLDHSYWTDCPNTIADLTVSSFAIDEQLNGSLLNSNIVPCSTISTEEDEFTAGFTCISLATILSAQSLIISSFSIFGEANDLVVSNSSQNAGLTQSNNFHTYNQCHLGSASNNTNIAWCKVILCKDPLSEYYSQTGFHPIDLNYPSIKSDMNNNQFSSGTVTITNPVNGAVFNPGDILTINVSGSSNIAKLTVAAGNNNIPPFAESKMSNSGIFSFPIPNDAIGEIRIIAVGIDNGSNFVDLDTISIYVTTNALLDSLNIYPKSIIVPKNGQTNVQLFGFFSDGIKRDLSYESAIQANIYDITTAQYLSPGIVRGLKVDTTFLTLIYLGKSLQVPIFVYQSDEPLSVTDPSPKETSRAKMLNVYPNPSHGFISVEFKTKIGILFKLNVYNQYGQSIYSLVETTNNELNNKKIPLTNISPGIYYITFTSESITSTEKLIFVK